MQPSAFASYLVHLLDKYKLSQRGLAKRAGINYVTVNRLVSKLGTGHTPASGTIEALANGLGCNQAERTALHSLANPVVDRMRSSMRQVLDHWREFGPEAGFDGTIEQALAKYLDE